MIYKLNKHVPFNRLRLHDVLQVVDEAGNMLLLGKYHTCGIVMESSVNSTSFVGTITSVILDSNITDSTFVCNGIRFTRSSDTNWTFRLE